MVASAIDLQPCVPPGGEYGIHSMMIRLGPQQFARVCDKFAAGKPVDGITISPGLAGNMGVAFQRMHEI